MRSNTRCAVDGTAPEDCHRSLPIRPDPRSGYPRYSALSCSRPNRGARWITMTSLPALISLKLAAVKYPSASHRRSGVRSCFRRATFRRQCCRPRSASRPHRSRRCSREWPTSRLYRVDVWRNVSSGTALVAQVWARGNHGALWLPDR